MAPPINTTEIPILPLDDDLDLAQRTSTPRGERNHPSSLTRPQPRGPRKASPGTRASTPALFAALKVRNYRIFVISQVFANIALWVQRIAQDWLILELTGSVTAVGITVALQFAPVLFFGLYGGVLADRFSKRTLLVCTQTAATLLSLWLGALLFVDAIQPWHIYLAAVLGGFITVVDNPARQAFVSEMVGPALIRNAISLNSSVFQMGALAGPAVAGILIHSLGYPYAFATQAAACAFVVIMLLMMRTSELTRPQAQPRARGQLRSGLDYVKQTSEIAWSIVLVAVLAILGASMAVLLAGFADKIYQTGVSGYSLFNSLVAIGALIGAVLSARSKGMPRLRKLVIPLFGLGLALAVASLSGSVYLFGALLIVYGLCFLKFLTGANTLVQTTSKPELRGRVMSLYVLVLLGGQSLGGPLVGWAAEHFGERWTMFGCGLAVMIAVFACTVAMARQEHLRLGLDRTGRVARISIIDA
ncbi:MFS transporter [Micrococcales bacterium 31B]|nr:MFS transporter [Micrococcales bacterium 31B]